MNDNTKEEASEMNAEINIDLNQEQDKKVASDASRASSCLSQAAASLRETRDTRDGRTLVRESESNSVCEMSISQSSGLCLTRKES